MPSYAYRGLDKSGKQVTGTLSAEDSHTAAVRVKALGVFPTDVRTSEAGAKKAHRAVKASGRVKSSDLTIFSRQLANLVKGGLPLMRVFSALCEHTESPRLRAVLEEAQSEIKGGKALWEALGAYPEIFPPLYVNMVKAGEASGQLSAVLVWLAEYLEKEQSRRNQIRSALAYPTLLVSVGIITIACLVAFVVPKFVAMFQEFNQALPIPTVVLIGISGFVSRWWWAMLAAIVVISFGWSVYSRTQSGRYNIDRLKLRLPLFGKLNLKSAVSRFARTTATLLQGGVPLFDSMTIVREVVGNEVLSRDVERVREGLREGQSFAARLRESDVFPPLLVNMAAVGEEVGELRDVLITVADVFEVEVDATLKQVISLLEPVIIVLIGSSIAFIILAMLLPVFQINIMG